MSSSGQSAARAASTMAGAAALASTLPFQLRRMSAAWWRRLSFVAGVVDGVGETLGDDVVEVGVDVGLEGEHVGGGEVVARS